MDFDGVPICPTWTLTDCNPSYMDFDGLPIRPTLLSVQRYQYESRRAAGNLNTKPHAGREVFLFDRLAERVNRLDCLSLNVRDNLPAANAGSGGGAVGAHVQHEDPSKRSQVVLPSDFRGDHLQPFESQFSQRICFGRIGR